KLRTRAAVTAGGTVVPFRAFRTAVGLGRAARPAAVLGLGRSRRLRRGGLRRGGLRFGGNAYSILRAAVRQVRVASPHRLAGRGLPYRLAWSGLGLGLLD